MKHIIPRTLLLCVTALLLLRGSSCTQIQRAYPPPTAGQVVQAVLSRGLRVRTMRAETRMSHRSEQGKIKGTVMFMASRGGKLRFDLKSPFDTPLTTLVSDGKDFSLLDHQKGSHYYGPASPCNIARLIQIVLDPDEVLTILAGATPVISHTDATIAWDDREGAEVLTLKGTPLTQVIRLDGHQRTWDVLSSEIRHRDGSVLLRTEASGYRVVHGLRLPGSLTVEQPGHKAELGVTFKRQEVNLELPAQAFELPAADGLPSKRLDCETRIDEGK